MLCYGDLTIEPSNSTDPLAGEIPPPFRAGIVATLSLFPPKDPVFCLSCLNPGVPVPPVIMRATFGTEFFFDSRPFLDGWTASWILEDAMPLNWAISKVGLMVEEDAAVGDDSFVP